VDVFVCGNPALPAPLIKIETIFFAMARAGLVARGAFHLADGEREGPLADVRTILLMGVTGRSGWDAFAASEEARDGAEHPLDRWSRRVIEGLAQDLGAVALYPFGGPPHFPFQQWARRAEPVHASPLGLLIHPVYGLWHSYRGALGFAEALDLAARETARSPCDSCAAKPCLAACPVGAFFVGGYDVAACAAHLRAAEGADCMNLGCRARRACPVGAEHAHGPEQAAFAMRVFLRAQEAC
jgi:hypothetical protein